MFSIPDAFLNSSVQLVLRLCAAPASAIREVTRVY